MKTRLFLATSIALVILIVASCSSGNKAFNQGDYDRAVYQAVKRLRSDSDNDKARSTLGKAYTHALTTHERKISNLKSSQDPLRWEGMLGHYTSINSLSEEILRCPACLDIVPNPKQYLSELVTIRQSAAEERYQLAVEALKSKKVRDQALLAHQHLVKANEFVPGYKDSRQLMEEAMYYATMHVVIEPVPAPVGALRLNQEFFNNKVMEYLNTNNINQYVRFYTPEEADARQLEWIDHRISMSFDQFALGNVVSHTELIEVHRDSVLLNPGQGNDVYGRVEAQFKRYEKGIIGSGLLDFRVVDPQLNRVISQEKFPSEFRWVTVWATFNGDKRALTEEQVDLIEKSELPVPQPQFMFEQFAAPLYDQVIRKITDFYRAS